MAKKQTTKEESLNKAIEHIEKAYGKGSIMRLGDKPDNDVPSISSGSLRLDKALGIGGWPRGRVTELFGAESAGKTTLAIHAMAEAQKKGGTAAIVDAEHAFDSVYAKAIGVDVKNLMISQPDSGEQALNIVDNLVRSGGVDIVVIDSVAALIPKAELEGEMGDAVIGTQARLMGQAMRKLSGIVSKTNTACIFINQLRDKVGVMFGPTEVTTGGHALKFYATVRADIRPKGKVKQDETILGSRARVKVVKNKLAPPFKQAEFDIIYGEGISKASEIIELGVEHGIIKQSGSWYSYGETKLGQGSENVRQLLKDNPELMEELEKKVREKL